MLPVELMGVLEVRPAMGHGPWTRTWTGGLRGDVGREIGPGTYVIP